MELAPDELEMLEGTRGVAAQKAMELLLRYGEALGAERFVDTNNVTVIMGTMPEVRVVRKIVPDLDMDEIASRLYLDSDERVVVDRVKAFTTANCYFRDYDYPDLQQGKAEACALAGQVEGYCRKLGIVPLLTCTPYQCGNLPTKGEHCAWTESSAIAYCNAVVGARTNIEGHHSSFCSAVIGKTPLWGMHLDENRLGKVVIDVEIDLPTPSDWSLMGYYAGMHVGLAVPIYRGIRRIPDLAMFMALCSAGIASGSVVMFHILGVTPEAATFEMASGGRRDLPVLRYGKAERAEAYGRLNHPKTDKVDVIILGCPHYTLERMGVVARMLEGKRVSGGTGLYITTCRSVKYMADLNGYTETITKAGGLVLVNSCGTILSIDPSKTVAADSAKMIHYIPGMTGVRSTWFGTTEECIEAAITGAWRGELR